MLGDNLQFQPINGQQTQQQPTTGTASPSSPVQQLSAVTNPNQSNDNTVFPGTTIPKVHSPQDGQRFKEIAAGSERFALELFSVSQGSNDDKEEFDL